MPALARPAQARSLGNAPVGKPSVKVGRKADRSSRSIESGGMAGLPVRRNGSNHDLRPFSRPFPVCLLRRRAFLFRDEDPAYGVPSSARRGKDFLFPRREQEESLRHGGAPGGVPAVFEGRQPLEAEARFEEKTRQRNVLPHSSSYNAVRRTT